MSRAPYLGTMNAIQKFIETVRAAWGPLSSETVASCQRGLEALARDPRLNVNGELHRDPEYGFLLLAHTEQEGLHRVPHDHGRGWVWGSGRGVVTVRFETAETPSGPVRSFAADDPALHAYTRPVAEGS